MHEHIIAGLRRAYAAFGRGDIQGAIDAVEPAPDILWIEPEEFYAGGTYHGPEGVARYLTLSYSASEKVQSVPEEFLEIGDWILVLVHFQAWPKGGGQPREGHIADVYTVRDGKIIRMQAYSDPEAARRAVGLPQRN
ncbi:MAG: nuclear transport factor 2 family protein [Ktedonobacterales bacterium]